MRNVLHLNLALARQRCRQGRGACVMWRRGGKGVMRGIAVLENHADRRACIDRGEMSGDECVRENVRACTEVC